MKTIKTIGVLLLVYAAGSFFSASINFFEWYALTRLVVIVIAAISCGIVWDDKKDDECNLQIINSKIGDSVVNSNHDKYARKYDEEKINLRLKADKDPQSRERLIFHGGCLSCTTPSKVGIGNCKGCQYFDADWSKPDLSDERK